jgi:hypothetical protein
VDAEAVALPTRPEGGTVTKMELNTYNPACDFCEQCFQHGHTAEDCCSPAARLSEQTRDAAIDFYTERRDTWNRSITDIMAEFADQQTAAVRHRLEAALKVIEHYADESNWSCPRCENPDVPNCSSAHDHWLLLYAGDDEGPDKAAEFLNHAEEKSDEN